MNTILQDEKPVPVSEGRAQAAIKFWQRPDIERARRLVDQWASCKRAKAAGVGECPTTDAIFERPVPLLEPWLDPRTGLWVNDEEMFIKTSTLKPLPEPRVSEMVVDRVLQGLATPRLAISLLYHLYPRTGPYEQEGELSEFRPRALLGNLSGKYLDRARTSLFSQLHRECLLRIASLGTGFEEVSEAK